MARQMKKLLLENRKGSQLQLTFKKCGNASEKKHPKARYRKYALHCCVYIIVFYVCIVYIYIYSIVFQAPFVIGGSFLGVIWWVPKVEQTQKPHHNLLVLVKGSVEKRRVATTLDLTTTSHRSLPRPKPLVTAADVAAVLSKWHGLPGRGTSKLRFKSSLSIEVSLYLLIFLRTDMYDMYIYIDRYT